MLCFKSDGALMKAGFAREANAGAGIVAGANPSTKSESQLETEITTALNGLNTSCESSDLRMSMVRYNLPQSYSKALASKLSSTRAV